MKSNGNYIKLFFLNGIIILSLVLLNLPLVSANNQKDFKVVLYHTNDIHGHLESSYNPSNKLSEAGFDFVKSMKSSTPNSILIDAGDVAQGSILTTYDHGASIMELMNDAGYDGMTLGNHEFDLSLQNLITNANLCKFPVVSANSILKSTGEPLLDGINGNNGCNFIKEVNGKKIGFFGITTEETTEKAAPSNVKDVMFKDAVETSREQVKILKNQSADVIVGIMHVGIGLDTKVTSHDIAQRVDGIDIIIDGHSHSCDSTKINNTVIQQTGTASANVGRIDIDFNNNGFNISASLIPAAEIGNNFKPDSELIEHYNKITESFQSIINKVVGRTETGLYGGSYNNKNISRYQETNLGGLIADAILWSGKDLIKGTEYEKYPMVCIQNGSGIRNTINTGYITMDDAHSVLPFGTVVSLKIITPEILYDILEANLSGFVPPNGPDQELSGGGHYPHISGFKFDLDLDQPSGNRISNLYLDDNGVKKELLRNDGDTKIVFAADSFINSGGSGNESLKNCPYLIQGETVDKVFSNYINKLTIENDGLIKYPFSQNRVNLKKDPDIYKDYTSVIKVQEVDTPLINKSVHVELDGDSFQDMTTNENGQLIMENLDPGAHNIFVTLTTNEGDEQVEKSADVFVSNIFGQKDATLSIENHSSDNIKSVMNIISQIPGNITDRDFSTIRFANTSYNSLNDADKTRVTNYDHLEKATLNMKNLEASNSVANGRKISNNIRVVVIIASGACTSVLLVVVLVLHKKKEKFLFYSIMKKLTNKNYRDSSI